MSMTLDDAPTSLRAQVEALNTGETYARAARYDADETPKTLPVEALRGMRMSMQRTVHEVQNNNPGRVFKIEGGEFRTKTRDIMVCLCVTRME